jgi:hypothetical protein
MRDFFIEALDKLIAVIIVILALAVVFGSIGIMAQGGEQILVGFLALAAGAVYVMLMGGMLYLFLGIYYNTKRTADILDNKRQKHEASRR